MMDASLAWPGLLPAGLVFLAGYLLGSIPFGYLITRTAGAGDIRKLGSGNIGATNVLRTGRKALALLTLLADVAKGALPAVIAWAWLGQNAAVLAGAGAILGHCFPIWLGFKGGKGVATAAGIILGLTPLVVPVLIAAFAAVLWGTRYVSLSSLVAAALAPLAAWAFGHPQAAQLYLLMAALVVAKHHANIGRLMNGSENRVSFKRAA